MLCFLSSISFCDAWMQPCFFPYIYIKKYPFFSYYVFHHEVLGAIILCSPSAFALSYEVWINRERELLGGGFVPFQVLSKAKYD